MREASEKDDIKLALGQPAISKLSIVDEMINEIAKPVWTQWFLQEGLLQVLEKWLAPLADGGCPNLSLRTKILGLLARINVSVLVIRTSATDLCGLYDHYFARGKIDRIVARSG